MDGTNSMELENINTMFGILIPLEKEKTKLNLNYIHIYRKLLII